MGTPKGTPWYRSKSQKYILEGYSRVTNLGPTGSSCTSCASLSAGFYCASSLLFVLSPPPLLLTLFLSLSLLATHRAVRNPPCGQPCPIPPTAATLFSLLLFLAPSLFSPLFSLTYSLFFLTFSSCRSGLCPRRGRRVREKCLYTSVC